MKASTKKWLVVGVVLLLCLVLLVVITLRFSVSAEEPSSVSTTSLITEEDSSVVVTPPSSLRPSTSRRPSSSAVSVANSGPEQAIQPDVTKPDAPDPPKIDEDAANNPDEVPSYTPEQTNPPAGNDQPQGGDTNNGKIYVPGFGWIDDEGGGGEGYISDGDGDPNKQVGDM